jgi:hypothetical protein
VVRIHSPRPILSMTYGWWRAKQPTRLPTQLQSCDRIPSSPYCGHGEERSHASLPDAFSCQPTRRFWPALAPVIEINVRHIGRTPQPEKLTGSEAPEGWIKKIDRPREGKVWVDYIHIAGGRLTPEGRVLDDHLHGAPDEVYDLLADAAARTARPLTVILERDGNYPPMAEMLNHLELARGALAAGRAPRIAS